MIRTPYRTLVAYNVNNTVTSNVNTFTLPFNDFDGLVAKLVVASLQSGAANQLNVFIQTSDDGGTTFYDCVNIGTATANGDKLWATIPVNIGDGAYIGSVTASALSGGLSSHLPALSNVVRVIGNLGSVTATALVNYTLTISANNQSAHV